MSFQAWSVVYGEQPSASKWNILGTNDSSFNDGTGIGSAAITNSKLASTAVSSSVVDWSTSGGVWYQEVARATLSSAAVTLSTSTFTARKYLKVLLLAIPAGVALDCWLRVNGDTGNNYNYRWYKNDATANTATSQPGFTVSATSNQATRLAVFEIINISSEEKLFRGTTIEAGTAGAGNLTDHTAVSAKWANTAAQITSLTMFNNAGGNMGVGSQIIVLGHD